jgi:hypothetical protein
MADLACAIADGAEVISDFRVMGDQEELFGLVASVPTAWRTLAEIAGGGERAQGKITAAVNAARRRAWAGVAARHGAIPGIRVADKMLDRVICIRLDASVVTCRRQGRSRAELQGVGLLTRCWLAAITLASRWPECCGPARRAATPPPITWRCWTPRSRRCCRGSGGG